MFKWSYILIFELEDSMLDEDSLKDLDNELTKKLEELAEGKDINKIELDAVPYTILEIVFPQYRRGGG